MWLTWFRGPPVKCSRIAHPAWWACRPIQLKDMELPWRKLLLWICVVLSTYLLLSHGHVGFRHWGQGARNFSSQICWRLCTAKIACTPWQNSPVPHFWSYSRSLSRRAVTSKKPSSWVSSGRSPKQMSAPPSARMFMTLHFPLVAAWTNALRPSPSIRLTEAFWSRMIPGDDAE